MKTRRGAESQRRHRGNSDARARRRVQAQRTSAHAAHSEGTFVRRSRVATRGHERHKARYCICKVFFPPTRPRGAQGTPTLRATSCLSSVPTNGLTCADPPGPADRLRRGDLRTALLSGVSR